MKYATLIFVVLVAVIILIGVRLFKSEHGIKQDFKAQYDSIETRYKAKEAILLIENKRVQDSLTALIKASQTEEKAIASAIKQNDNDYTKKIRAVDSLNIDSSVQLRAVLRGDFRRTYGY